MARYRDSESEKVVEGFAGMNPMIAGGIFLAVLALFGAMIYLGSIEM